jgi:hypothetical protein
MNLDPAYLQAALVVAGIAVLFGPEVLKLLKGVRLPSFSQPSKKVGDVDAFVALALVRDYLGAFSGPEEQEALETLCTAVVLKGGEDDS